MRRERLDNQLTQSELAKELKVYKSTIDKWERKITIPNANNKKQIIKFLGYDPIKKTITI